MVGVNLNTQREGTSQFYIGYLRDAAALFEGAIQRLKHCDDSQCDVADATDMAHRIIGNAAMYDFPDLGLKAGKVEAILRSGSVESANLILPLITLIDDIHTICRESDKSKLTELPITLAVDNEDLLLVSQSTADVSINRKSILLAYQDVWLSELMASLLGPEYQIATVHTGAEVLEFVRTQSPNLIILEDELGEMEALDLVKELKASGRLTSTSVFIAFGENSHKAIAKAISLGVQGFTDDKHEILEIVDFAKKHLDQPAQTVLVVDDDPMVRELLKYSLTSGGLTVDMASDGIEALAYLSQKTPDLILLDRFMPRLEGGTVLYEVQSKINLKSIPVLILTAMVNNGEAKSWFERGAADFIPKPFDPEEVLMRVRQHLEAKQIIA